MPLEMVFALKDVFVQICYDSVTSCDDGEILSVTGKGKAFVSPLQAFLTAF